MLTALSNNLMHFFDRLILAGYSTEVMNAATIAALNCTIFQFAGISIASIAEVFVGQYNGARDYHKIGEPVWQMIWFSLALFVIFCPVALWGGTWLLPPLLREQGLTYFQWVMFASPLSAISAALSSFYVGRGRTKLVIIAAVSSNLLNIILNFILVFGIKGIIPSLGATGSAIGTSLSLLLQVLIMGIVFLDKKNRKRFNTGKFQFRWNPCWECLRIGAPIAIGHMIELAAWATTFRIVATVHFDYVTVQTVGNTIFILFSFVTEGIQKGVTAIASNLIGAKKEFLINKLIFSFIKLHIIFLFIFSIPLLFFPDILVQHFLTECSPSVTVYRECVIVLRWIWTYFIFDGIVWGLVGVLTAGGDTRFIMVVNALSSWGMAILPIYISIRYYHAPASAVWMLYLIYIGSNMCFFIFRYRGQRWRHDLIDDATNLKN